MKEDIERGLIRWAWPCPDHLWKTHTTDRRALQTVALADDPSCGNIPRLLWWQVSCPAPTLSFLWRKVEHTIESTKKNQLVITCMNLNGCKRTLSDAQLIALWYVPLRTDVYSFPYHSYGACYPQCCLEHKLKAVDFMCFHFQTLWVATCAFRTCGSPQVLVVRQTSAYMQEVRRPYRLPCAIDFLFIV